MLMEALVFFCLGSMFLSWKVLLSRERFIYFTLLVKWNYFYVLIYVPPPPPHLHPPCMCVCACVCPSFRSPTTQPLRLPSFYTSSV